ncbi:CDP-diacylglycerol--inositol 3-phosphatidyltransferase-like [Artemia franciscana]|uniref:CDP-diacylglycerol--inositol 3-phosphatidyltransferase-like n=1 Tax=Artemia franciscana TaxID=6661 RepID=UPI0032DB6F58
MIYRADLCFLIRTILQSMFTTDNVFLFIPNLIGYIRVVFGIAALYVMPSQPTIAATLYLLSGILDAFDGHAARYFNQSSQFGAMLDMLTDRCMTMALLVNLATFYPSWVFAFQLSMVTDISCHWIHIHTSLLLGKRSHKCISPSENTFLRFYYTSRTFLFTMCAGNELFYAMLYLLYFTEGPLVLGTGLFRILVIVCMPIAIFKSLLAVLQGYIAWKNLGGLDIQERQQLKEKNSKSQLLL